MNTAIHRAIDDLVDLAEMLGDEIVEQTVDQNLTPRGRACKEALQTAQVLSRKLESVIRAPGAGERQMQLGGCASCDDL